MPLERCPSCNGKREVPCRNCDGTGTNPGYQPSPDERKPVSEHCKSCHGSGKTKCRKCDGTGFIG